MKFATAPEAQWRGNFRELSASITRMAALADDGRITEKLVDDENIRLKAKQSAARSMVRIAYGSFYSDLG
ncbi:MAG: hypothetical protein WAK55_34050 [Xanthobacteraceae bacterium]